MLNAIHNSNVKHANKVQEMIAILKRSVTLHVESHMQNAIRILGHVLLVHQVLKTQIVHKQLMIVIINARKKHSQDVIKLQNNANLVHQVQVVYFQMPVRQLVDLLDHPLVQNTIVRSLIMQNLNVYHLNKEQCH